jgi:hypothetical protein
MNYSVFIGRVGALAVALGIGIAVGIGIAWADQTSGTGSADGGSSASAGNGAKAANDANRASQAAAKPNAGPRSQRAATANGTSGTDRDSESRNTTDSKPLKADPPASDQTSDDSESAATPSPEPQTGLRFDDVSDTPTAANSSGSAALDTRVDDIAEPLTPATTLATQPVATGSTQGPTDAVDLTGATSIADAPQMVAAPEPAEAQPNVPLTLSPGLWKVYENNPNTTHPIPSSPSAVAAVLSLHWMRREVERADAQQAPTPVAQTTSLTAASAALAEPTAVVVDDTAALQASFDALRPGDTLTLQPRTYYYSDVLYVRRSNVVIEGNGATLYSTNPDAAAVVIQGNAVTLQNLNLSAPIGQAREDSTSATRLVFGGDGNVIRNVTITGGQSAGVYITGASNFLLERVTVQDTAADGVQITNGSNNGVLNNVTTLRTGDDAIAIVSYQYPAMGTVHDITINNPVVNGAAQRGLVVTGGERITFNNVNVSNTALSGVWIGSQPAPFYTQGVNGVTVNGGTLTNTNSGGLPLGAVAVVAQNPNTTVSNVTVENLNIVNTPPSSYTNVGLYTQGGTLSHIVFRNIAIWQPIPTVPLPFYTNAPAGTYSATGFMVNGVPVPVAPAAAVV